MTELAYYEYALVLPEERYLIEVESRHPTTGESRGQDELEKVAQEALLGAVGQAGDQLKEKLKPNPINASDAQALTKVQQLASGSGYKVFLVE